jgi:hypothetical protein
LLKRKPDPGHLNETYFLTLLVRIAAPAKFCSEWRSKVRQPFISQQSDSDAYGGSWYFPDGDPAAKWGGRLYCTVVSSLIMSARVRVKIWSDGEEGDFPL